MSGGSYNYLHEKVSSMAEQLEVSECPVRRTFAEHLKLVAGAMLAIEWVDSCDWARGDELAPIRLALHTGAELAQATVEAKRALVLLEAMLAEAESDGGKRE